MNRRYLITIIVLTFTSLSCSLFTKVDEPVSTLPAVPLVSTVDESKLMTQTLTLEPSLEPTYTIEEPTLTAEPTITEAPTSTPPGPFEYTDTFDGSLEYWSDDVIVTTQTQGRDLYSKGVIENGKLVFKIDDKETYMYKYFLQEVPGNVSIEVEYQSYGHLNNGTALICKVNEERTSWYEVRVSSTSDYFFFLYDKSRKTEEGKNPYLLLGKGKFKIDELYPTKPNNIKLTCQDSELILDANHGMRIINQSLETNLDGYGVGLGAMAYDVIGIRINYESVTIREVR